jgi:glycosyltransferase involved in cell wall biosynthesis
VSISVSVVVPARDEQDSIVPLLDSLLQQTWPAAEIVIVDAGSLDRTAQMVREYSREYGAAAVPIRLLTLGPAYPGIARNAGVEAAVSSHIAFTDAGIRVDRQWLERLCAPLQQAHQESAPPPDVVFGSYEPVVATFFAQCAATAYVPARSPDKGKEIRGPSIASCLLRKSVFEAAGGFPPYRAAEDLMFLDRIRDQDWTTSYAPHAIARWEMATGWWSTFRRFRLYSYHNLVAGRGRYWHRGVARWYTLAMPFVILSCFQPTGWLAVPLSGAGARIAITIWRKRKEKWGSPFNPLHWIGVGLVLMTLDAATFGGAVWWAWDKLRGRLPLDTPHTEAAPEQTPA